MDGVGVDGCPGGWIAAAVDGKRVEWRLFVSFREILKAYPKTPIAVDTPIGLLADTPRPADVQARRWLVEHGGTGSSVFPSPLTRHHQLWTASRVHPKGHGITIQAWNILDKIDDVQGAGVKPGDRWVVEAHPEMSFRSIPGSTVVAPKNRPDGTEQRIATLRGLGWKIPDVKVPARGIFEDALDATAIAWTAIRHGRGDAKSLPKKPGKKEPRIVL